MQRAIQLSLKTVDTEYEEMKVEEPSDKEVSSIIQIPIEESIS